MSTTNLNGWTTRAKAQKLLDDRDGEQPTTFDTVEQGFPIHVDRPKGFIHFVKGTDIAAKYKCDYGRFKGYVGRDGELLDVFLGPDKNQKEVHVLVRGGVDPEDKVTFYMSKAAAKTLYDRGVKEIITYANKDDFHQDFLVPLKQEQVKAASYNHGAYEALTDFLAKHADFTHLDNSVAAVETESVHYDESDDEIHARSKRVPKDAKKPELLIKSALFKEAFMPAIAYGAGRLAAGGASMAGRGMAAAGKGAWNLTKRSPWIGGSALAAPFIIPGAAKQAKGKLGPSAAHHRQQAAMRPR